MGRVNAARGAATGRTRGAVRRTGPGADTGTGAVVAGAHGGGSGVVPAGVVLPDEPGAHAAGLVWGVLTAAVDPLSATAIGLSATVAPQLARAALELFERAGLVLRIPGEPTTRGARQELWVLAGGVREGTGIAAAAEAARLAADGCGSDPGLPTADHTNYGVGLQNPATGASPAADEDDPHARQGADLEEVLPFPKELAGARPGVRRVWKALVESERVLRTVEVAEAAGISRSAAASALSSLARVRAVCRSREDGSDTWVLPPDALAVRDKALGVNRPTALPGADGKPVGRAAGGLRPAPHLPARDKVTPFPHSSAPPTPELMAVGVVSGLRRLRKGELEVMVLKELRRRYPEEFGPTGLSHLLGGYSSGAITNALVRLQVKQSVECTCEAPKRYRAIPAPDGTGTKRRKAR